MASGGSGANAYWPGFVDALTNVVIAMIFVVITLAVSLSAVASRIGKQAVEKAMKDAAQRPSASPPVPTPPAPAEPAAAAAAPAAPGQPQPAPVAPESLLPGKLRIAVAGNEAAASAPPPLQIKPVRNSLKLEFSPAALTLDRAASEQLGNALKALPGGMGSGRVVLVATGPFLNYSDNQRNAYVRVMAVRNQLLDMGWKPEQISVKIDTEAQAATPAVNVAVTP